MYKRQTYDTVRDIRRDAFAHIQNLPLSYLDAHPTGDTVSRMIADVDTFADGLLMGFTQLFSGVMTILGTLGFMLTLSAPITLLVVLITPLSLLVANFIAKRTYAMFRLQSVTRGEQTALIDEAIGEQKLVQAFGHEAQTLAAFDEVNERLRDCSLKEMCIRDSSKIKRSANALLAKKMLMGMPLVTLFSHFETAPLCFSILFFLYFRQARTFSLVNHGYCILCTN